METATITATSGPSSFMRTTMTPTMDIHERIQQSPAAASFDAEIRELSTGPEDPEDYVIYLNTRGLLDRYPRLKRENPDALVHLERLDDDMWALEVYRSEAAKHAYAVSCHYREEALSTLTVLFAPRQPPDA
jgi:hypothetical protein